MTNLRQLVAPSLARTSVSCLVIIVALVAGANVKSNEDSLTARSTARLPNIIIILADDLGYGDIGAYGAKKIKTPHIDRLAAHGIRFTQAYASANVCSPSRAGLLTGRYAIRSGLAWKVVTATSTHGLPKEEETLAELTKRRGYETFLVGKWHLGNLKEFSPLDHGFDRFFGVPHSNDMPDFALYDDRMRIEDPVDQASLTRRYTQQAVEFIDEKANTPFFLFLSHTFPHIPLFASGDFNGRSDAGIYGDTVEEIDWSTGQVIDALKRNGIVENTLVIFTSDNGPFFEGSTAGFKGVKGDGWEGGFRIPFIIHWPAVVDSVRTTDAMTMNIDLLPTIADLLDLAPLADEIDGKSIRRVIHGSNESPHEYLFYFNNERVVGVRSRDWKFLTHVYYTSSLGAFEKFDQLPGFNASYDMLLKADDFDGESYSYADREPRVLERHKDALAAARERFSGYRTRDLERTYPE